MASHTTLVHVHVETAHKVAAFIGSLLPAGGEKFVEDCAAAINAQNTSQLMRHFLSQQDAIYALENDSDIQTLFQAIFSIIYTLSDDTKDTASIISSIIAATFASKDVKPNTRLSVAVILFNLIFAEESKCEVLNAILEYALVTKQTRQVAHLYNRVDAWVREWKMSVDSHRKLLKNFADVMEAEGDKSVAVKALVKYIQSYKGDAKSYPAEVEACVTQAVLSAINSPVDAFSDRAALLESVNMQHLSANLQPLVDLLKIICDGSLPEFLAFSSKSAAIFSKNSLDVSSLEHNIKLLALCTLAAQSSEKVLTFATIQNELRIPAEEVELWVIEAIGEKLMDASIDQISGSVTINRYVHLSFGPAHWRNVQAKLRNMRAQVTAAVSMLQNGKAPTVTMT